ncbi:UDP-2,3-diacylglucosamine diphosphatase [bacterium]|nr:UDP-2,3-diacylglucosamine diphosphatase [bacterium]
MDAIIISDIHLGSPVCQAKGLREFLERIYNKNIVAEELILNGDVFDSWDFRRLKKTHWKVLSMLRHLSDKMHIVWINGNHDGPSEIVSHLLGIDVVEEYRFMSGGKKILAIHGHQFDEFITQRPITTMVGDFAYRMLQKIDPSFQLARRAKRASKTFLRSTETIESRAIEYARRADCSIVCCGHTHLEVSKPGEICYFNSGCWTESPSSYLTVDEGEVRQCYFDSLVEHAAFVSV